MTTNGFTINGVVTDSTNINGVNILNYYLIAAKDTDDIFYIPTYNENGSMIWGSYNGNYNATGKVYNIFGSFAPDLQNSTLRSFLFGGMNVDFVKRIDREDGTSNMYGNLPGAGGYALGEASSSEKLSFVPTVNVEKDRILTGVWYSIFQKETQNKFGGLCYPLTSSTGRWRGINKGAFHFKSLVFTFIPMNNFIITPSTESSETLSLSAFYTWRTWSDSLSSPNCLGSNIGNNCVFTLQNIYGKIDKKDLFGFEFTSSGKCEGTTYSSCGNKSTCKHVSGEMVCVSSSIPDNSNSGASPDKKVSKNAIIIAIIISVIIIALFFIKLMKKRS